jgi:hypothetical protein
MIANSRGKGITKETHGSIRKRPGVHACSIGRTVRQFFNCLVHELICFVARGFRTKYPCYIGRSVLVKPLEG